MTATRRARRRGQPLAVLAVVLVGWVAMRALPWQDGPVPTGTAPATREGPAAPVRMAGVPRGRPAEPGGYPALSRADTVDIAAFASFLPRRGKGAPSASAPARTLPAVAGGAERWPLPQPGPIVPIVVPPPDTFAALEALSGPAPAPPPRPGQEPAPPLVRAAASRWSGDSWLLVRRGSAGLAAAPSFASYGASQAGGVLRYALDPASGMAPQAYVRLSRALGSVHEAEAALGLSLRPLAALPIRALAEARAQRSGGRTRLRPAASLVSAVPPQALPLGAEAEVYAQAGYVAAALDGEGGGTLFFDAQLIADRAFASPGSVEVRLGAGAWAGGQQGAARLDLGPRASARLRLGPAPVRLALDWRLRVAGNAAPGSGPALTFSAGF